MLLNYLKLSFRLIARNPFFTFVNVVGLSVGFAVFFVLWQFSQNELNSDRQWKDWDRIARLGFIWQWTDDNVNWSQSQFGDFNLPEIIKNLAADYGEVEAMTRIFRQENFAPEHIPYHSKNLFITRLDERGDPVSFKESNITYADPNFFNFFSIHIISGNPDKILVEANTIAISQKFAKRYFGDYDPINQTLLIDNKIALKVTGVFEDLPPNTHFEFEAVISDVGIENYFNQIGSGGCHSYLKLRPGVNMEILESKLKSKSGFYFSERIPITQRNMVKAQFYLQPLAEVPFVSYVQDYFKPKSKFYLNILLGVGVFTMVIAWVNYIQMSVSFYLKRLKEVGVRKTCGARLIDLILQFLTESFLINLLSLVLALTIVQLIKHPLQAWFGFYVLPWQTILTSTIAVFCLVLMAGVLISGFLPVIIFVKFSPGSLFKVPGRLTGRFYLVKSLVIFQFGFSVTLIIWVFAVNNQLDYVLNANYGLNRNQVGIIDLPQVRNPSFDADLAVLMEKIKAAKGIQGATSFTSITGDADNDEICLKRSAAMNDACVDTNGGVDENFIPFYQIKLLAGRNFQKDLPSDSSTLILSRKAITRIGFKSPEEAVGSTILVNTGSLEAANFQYAEIIGVIEDYKGGKESFLINQGMGEGHGGIILTYKDKFIPSSTPQKIGLRLNPAWFHETGKAIEDLYKQVFPGQLFRFYFLDDQVARFYDGEKTARNQILLFTFIAIGIACLGLLGMISNKVVEKTKEIGIRKVLGAELYQIAQILLNTTVKQIIVATVIGIPVAWYLTQQYLQKFSERIELQW